MNGIEIGEKLVLNDDRKTDRGPIVSVRAVIAGSDGVKRTGNHSWYGVSVKAHRERYDGEIFECYLSDFSDHRRSGKQKGWMEFVNPDDRKRWEEWLLKSIKKA